MKRLSGLLIVPLILLLAACTTVTYNTTPRFSSNAKWMVTPFINNTETPRAGNRAAAITIGLLRTRGIKNVVMYNKPTASKGMLPQQFTRRDQARAIRTARSRGIRYVMTGTVNEWRYKAGLDGEPVVGITLDTVDTQTKQVVWTSVASGSGWGRSSISHVAQKMINESLYGLALGGIQH